MSSSEGAREGDYSEEFDPSMVPGFMDEKVFSDLPDDALEVVFEDGSTEHRLFRRRHDEGFKYVRTDLTTKEDEYHRHVVVHHLTDGGKFIIHAIDRHKKTATVTVAGVMTLGYLVRRRFRGKE